MTTTSPGIRCMLMRGGTSKGAYFLADDLPAEPAERDDMLRVFENSGWTVEAEDHEDAWWSTTIAPR